MEKMAGLVGRANSAAGEAPIIQLQGGVIVIVTACDVMLFKEDLMANFHLINGRSNAFLLEWKLVTVAPG